MTKLLLSVAIGAVSMFGATPFTATDLNLRGLRFIVNGAPEFNGKLHQMGLASNAAVQKMSPYSVILVNSEPKRRGICGYALKWEVMPQRPPNVPANLTLVPNVVPELEISPNEFAWRHVYSRKGRRPLMQADDLQFLSPTFKADGFHLPPNDVPAEVLKYYAGASSIKLSLDLVVLEDGSMYGLDTLGNGQYFQAMLSGRHDLQAEVYKAQNKKKQTNAQAVAFLIGVAAQTPVQGTGWIPAYRNARIALAKEIKSMKDHGATDAQALGVLYIGMTVHRPRLSRGD